MYSDLLVPFSESSATAPHGAFNVTVGKTTSLDATDQTAQWNYNANKWDYWYEFVINEPSADGNYTVYLNSFVEELFPERTLSTVGLYFEIEHFGARIPLSAAAPQPRTVTSSFTASDFSFGLLDHDDSSTKNGTTVELTDCGKDGNYLVIGYNGLISYHNGSITVSSPDKALLSSIELTYRSGYTGGNVTVSAGSFSKSGTTGTWTGSVHEVTLNLARSGNNYAQVSTIKVTTKSL